MIIRSDHSGLDAAYSFLQGYAGAHAINFIQKAIVINPLNGGLFLGGFALTEKLFFQATHKYVPQMNTTIGPIPIQSKSVVSYGLATYTTLKVMQLVGLILAVPTLVTVVGMSCAVALALGYRIQGIHEERRKE